MCIMENLLRRSECWAKHMRTLNPYFAVCIDTMHEMHWWIIGVIASINVHIVAVLVFIFRPASLYAVGGSKSIKLIVADHMQYIWIFFRFSILLCLHFPPCFWIWSLGRFWLHHRCCSHFYAPHALARLFGRWSCTLICQSRSYIWGIFNSLACFAGLSITYMFSVACSIPSIMNFASQAVCQLCIVLV